MYETIFWIVFLGWHITIALIARRIAVRKGFDGTTYLLIGLLFSVPTLIVAIVKTAIPVNRRERPPCPSCSKPIRREERRCRSCGTELDETQYLEHLKGLIAFNHITKSYKALQGLKTLDSPKVIPLLKRILAQVELADRDLKYVVELENEVRDELGRLKTLYGEGAGAG